MRTKVVVTEVGNMFLLRTSMGMPLGHRLLTVDAEKGKELPLVMDKFPTRLEADRAALRWNEYLLYASRKKAKRRTAGTEE